MLEMGHSSLARSLRRLSNFIPLFWWHLLLEKTSFAVEKRVFQVLLCLKAAFCTEYPSLTLFTVSRPAPPETHEKVISEKRYYKNSPSLVRQAWRIS